MKRAILLTAVLLGGLTTVGSASAVVLTSESGIPLPQNDRMQQWASHMAVASYAGPIWFSSDRSEMEQVCGEDYGCADTYTPEVFSCRSSACGAVDVLYHELGHEFDQRYMTNADRRWFSLRIAHDTRRSIGPWEEVSAENHYNGYMDLFADFYSDCGQRLRIDGWPWKHDPRICSRINRIGRAHHADPPFRCPLGQFRWLDPACYHASR